MKELGNRVIAQVHFFILVYALYGAWVLYDEHAIRMEEQDSLIPGIQILVISFRISLFRKTCDLHSKI